tara:strand:- start:792 stop:1628 length:837 start_codon:yes stop_codon:yes gene_type:complete
MYKNEIKMLKKLLYTIVLLISSTANANEPKDWQLGFQNPASQSMYEIVKFHDYMLVPIIVAISGFVLFLMAYTCIRFRASRNLNPSKRTHNVAVEILWTLIPCLILIVMAVPSFKILYSQDTIPKADVTIKAVGYQWYWGYEYLDEKIIFDSYMIEEEDLKPGQPRLLAVDNEVVVPVNKVVKVLITANDVLHAWALPSFGVKRDAMPGRVNETWFKADRVGTYYGQCSELCGIKHAFMPITVRVVTDEEYKIWLDEAKIKFAKDEKVTDNNKLLAKN